MDTQALGRYLRETREAKEITLEDAERALRIRQRTLESFELGQFTFSDASDVQIRGFVRNYARYLGLEEDRILAYYEAARREAQSPRRRNGKRTTQNMTPVAPRKITDTNPTLPPVPLVQDRPDRRSLLNTLVMLLLAVASIAVIVFVVGQLIGQTQPDQAANSSSDNGSILAQLPPSPTYTPLPTFTPLPSPTPLSGFQQNYAGQPVLVTIQTTQRTWLRVASDGVQRFVGMVRPGDALPDFPARDNVALTASNAEALQVIYNGKTQPSFGGRGQKVDIVFKSTGIQVSSGPGFDPTSAFSPTPLPTSAIDVGAAIAALTPSNTPGPSPTPTLTPSITPTPSDTPTATPTPTLTFTPSNTPTMTDTPTITPTPTATAILPPRVTQEGLPPTKEGN
jgi:cytoskeletal protein RodZ